MGSQSSSPYACRRHPKWGLSVQVFAVSLGCLFTLFLVAATQLVNIAPAAASAGAERSGFLGFGRQFERPAGTTSLSELRLKDGRNYFLLIQRMSPKRLELANIEQARRTFIATRGFKHNLGHVMAGWRCDGREGLISQYGETRLQGPRMLLAGWGLTTFLSTFTDGYLRGFSYLEDMLWANAFERIKAQVLAIEITSAQCAALKAYVRRYATHPREPWRNFSMLLSPRAFRGGGCLTFAVAVGEQAGALKGLWPALFRRLPLYSGVLGRLHRAPSSVKPFGLARKLPYQAVPFSDLFSLPWQRGRRVGWVKIMDPELLYSVTAFARAKAGATTHFDRRRALPSSDRGLQRIRKTARRWLANLGPRRVSTRETPWASVVLVEHR